MEDLPDARRLVGPAANWVALIGAFAIMLMAGAIVGDVLMRWLFNAPILGVDDLGKYILAVIVSSFFPLWLVGGHFVTFRFVGKAQCCFSFSGASSRYSKNFCISAARTPGCNVMRT